MSGADLFGLLVSALVFLPISRTRCAGERL